MVVDGAVLVEVLDGRVEPLVVELVLLSLLTLAPAHPGEPEELSSMVEELTEVDTGSIFPLEGS